MAGLEPLKRLIYHEKQESGSMLCAQHALNTLLQGNYFTASDLSAIATKVDILESTLQTENRSGQSANMDDTGFFSVQVINEALQVWGMRMVHWRSNEMAEYQDKPYTQFAFILNLEQHWFTVRRFGITSIVEMATTQEAEHCHWFNLNSFLNEPEWIGRIYLNMMLKQAEEEGYSVYAVARIDPDSPFPVGYSAADEVASTLPQPRSASSGGATLSMNRTQLEQDPGTSQMQTDIGPIEGFEDEDMELQAALQASITGVEASPSRFTARGGPSTRSTRQPSIPQPVEAPVDENDPVASSLARSRAIMEQMLRHQSAALQENYEDEVRGLETNNRFAALQASAASQSSRKRTRGEEDEDEEIRRAIEASRAGTEPQEVVSDDEEDEERTRVVPKPQEATSSRRFADHTGVYDDDDAALQAALKASLEDNPTGAVIPEEPKRPQSNSRTPQNEPVSEPQPAISRTMSKAIAQGDDEDEEYDEDEEVMEDKGKGKELEDPETNESVDRDEMRRRRLARFGGGG